MLMPIPDDWDGESTCDYVVQWPDSTYWRIILRGLLSNPSLEAFWDKSTGDVSQVIDDFEPILDYVLNELRCGDMLPVGAITLYAATGAPTGWLLCDGSAYDRSAYAELFAKISITYGAGNGSTTFNVPDLRGRVPVGRQPSDFDYFTLGQTGGEKTHTLTTAEMPSHTHTQDSHNHNQNSHNHNQDSHNHTQNAHQHVQATRWNSGIVGGGSGGLGSGSAINFGPTGPNTNNATATNQAATATNQAATATNQAATATNQNTGGGSAHNNLQPYIILNYIIKAF